MVEHTIHDYIRLVAGRTLIVWKQRITGAMYVGFPRLWPADYEWMGWGRVWWSNEEIACTQLLLLPRGGLDNGIPVQVLTEVFLEPFCVEYRSVLAKHIPLPMFMWLITKLAPAKWNKADTTSASGCPALVPVLLAASDWCQCMRWFCFRRYSAQLLTVESCLHWTIYGCKTNVRLSARFERVVKRGNWFSINLYDG